MYYQSIHKEREGVVNEAGQQQHLIYTFLRLQLNSGSCSVCNGVSDCACEAQGGLHHRWSDAALAVHIIILFGLTPSL